MKEALLAAIAGIRQGLAEVQSSPDSATAPAPAAASATSTDDNSTKAVGGIGALIAAAVSGARIALRSPFEAAAVAVHCMLLEHGFVCTGSTAEDRALPGFAAPARGTPLSCDLCLMAATRCSPSVLQRFRGLPWCPRAGIRTLDLQGFATAIRCCVARRF